MALTKDSVLDALKGISVSGGIDILSAGVLSEIVIHKDKVYFALNVPQKDARAYEPVRKAADPAIPSSNSSAVARLLIVAISYLSNGLRRCVMSERGRTDATAGRSDRTSRRTQRPIKSLASAD